MQSATQAVVTRIEDRQRVTWDDPARGDVGWFTLISAGLTPTSHLSAGIAEFAPRGGRLALHRHAQPEIYYITEGSGLLTIDGIETAVGAGSAVFIPGNAEHGIRNAGDTILRLFYVFPADRFEDIVYRFTASASAS